MNIHLLFYLGLLLAIAMFPIASVEGAVRKRLPKRRMTMVSCRAGFSSLVLILRRIVLISTSTHHYTASFRDQQVPLDPPPRCLLRRLLRHLLHQLLGLLSLPILPNLPRGDYQWRPCHAQPLSIAPRRLPIALPKFVPNAVVPITIQNAGRRPLDHHAIASQDHSGTRVKTALMMAPVPQVKLAASQHVFPVWLCIAVRIMMRITVPVLLHLRNYVAGH